MNKYNPNIHYRTFERHSTIKYIDGVEKQNWQQFNKKLWQRNYWEHIIRNNDEYLKIAKYIVNEDKLNDAENN